MRVAIVGPGHMGARHASAMTRAGHELVTVVGRRQEAADALAGQCIVPKEQQTTLPF